MYALSTGYLRSIFLDTIITYKLYFVFFFYYTLCLQGYSLILTRKLYTILGNFDSFLPY